MYTTSRPAKSSIGGPAFDDSEEEVDVNIEQDASQEFDDTDVDADDDDNGDEDDDDEPVCKRYTAKAVCHGLSRKYDEDEYLLGNYLDKEAARKKVLKFKDWVREQLPKCRPELELDTYTESTRGTKRTFEQKFVFGDDEDVVCRAWFDEELYNPSEEAYQRAKVYRACQPTPLWYVNWERTIAPYEEPEEDEGLEDESMKGSDSSNALETEEDSEEDASRSETLGVEQIIKTESAHEKDTDEIATESSQRNDGLVSSDSPMEFPTISSAATLIPEADDSIKDQPISNGDLSDKVDVDSPIIEEEIDDLFSGEPEEVSVPADQPTPSSDQLASPEPSSRQQSTQANPIPNHVSPETTIIRPTFDQLRHYTTRSLANRHAKDVFMRWFMERLPGSENQAYISLEDESMEEDLRAIGDRSCWERKEEFYRADESVPGGQARVMDRLRVWVAETKAYGPRN